MYLIDSTAVWRIQRDPSTRERWRPAIEAGEVRSCAPQRIELCRSARNLSELEQMSENLIEFYPDASVPKGVWRWIDSAQRTLAHSGVIRAFSLVDLVICSIAAQRWLTVLHDDNDFVTAARHLTDVRERRI